MKNWDVDLICLKRWNRHPKFLSEIAILCTYEEERFMEYEKTEEYKEMISRMEVDSPYKRRASRPKKWMSVPEMGELLGLKKTERYWLVHKNYFECKEVLGKMRINIESFEKWYANQIKYHKVTGEEPGKELKEWSYSITELAEMLGLTDGVVYDLIKRDNIEVVIVDYWKRVPKVAFQNWYENQSRYRTREDKEKDAELEAATITMPEMARLLGISRKNVYGILTSSKYKHFFQFVTIAEKRELQKKVLKSFWKVRIGIVWMMRTIMKNWQWKKMWR